jgi:hypothetical protein
LVNKPHQVAILNLQVYYKPNEGVNMGKPKEFSTEGKDVLGRRVKVHGIKVEANKVNVRVQKETIFHTPKKPAEIVSVKSRNVERATKGVLFRRT